LNVVYVLSGIVDNYNSPPLGVRKEGNERGGKEGRKEGR